MTLQHESQYVPKVGFDGCTYRSIPIYSKNATWSEVKWTLYWGGFTIELR